MREISSFKLESTGYLAEIRFKAHSLPLDFVTIKWNFHKIRTPFLQSRVFGAVRLLLKAIKFNETV